MSGRSLEDYAHERDALDEAHAQNEAGRDTFVALAHTALFAASVSFIGAAVPLGEAVWRTALIASWAMNVLGLIALTVSFTAARRAIDARRAALNAATPPNSRVPEALNSISLWTFPASLLCLFSFTTANVVHPHVKPSTVTSTNAGSGTAGLGATTACAKLPARPVQSGNRCDPAAEGAKPPTRAAGAASPAKPPVGGTGISLKKLDAAH